MDLYFSGQKPDFSVPLHLRGTEFQKEVWEILCDIPYGNAVAHNPVSVIVPCHRVLGSKESLTGYAGGLERKIKLLELEKVPRY